MPTDRQPIGLKIKRARERRRLSQTQLADLVGVSQKTIDNWEHDRSYPRSAIGALEERLGRLTDDGDPTSPPAAAEPEEAKRYPDLVDDPFKRYIWDYPGEDASAIVRGAAVQGAQLGRDLEAGNVGYAEQSEARRA